MRTDKYALINNVLGSISLDDKSFFYNQPLEAKNLERSSTFETRFCPTNVPRLFNSLESYVCSLPMVLKYFDCWIHLGQMGSRT